MKYKLTFALVAALTSTAFAEFKAPLPEFKNEKQLAEWRAEKSVEAASQGYFAEEAAFYTGKPYLASFSGYAFKFRSYDPELARWTSEDPSGFPDGSNNTIYVNNKSTNAIDLMGLNIYSITNPNLAGGGGHTAVIITYDDKFAYRSYGPGGLDHQEFDSLGEAAKYAFEDEGYRTYNEWDTDSSQDTAARIALLNYDYLGDLYQLATHNCVDAVMAALAAAGVSYDRTTNVPNSWDFLNQTAANNNGLVRDLYE